MNNSLFSQSINKLIAENINLTIQVVKHYEETQMLSKRGYVPFKHMVKLYGLWIQHQNKVKNPTHILIDNLGQEVEHG